MSRNECSKWSPDPSYTFSHLDCPNTRLYLIRVSNNSSGCLALTRHIKLSGLSKMRLRRSRESNVASGRRALRTNFRLLAIPKYDFSEVEKAMIQGVPGTI